MGMGMGPTGMRLVTVMVLPTAGMCLTGTFFAAATATGMGM